MMANILFASELLEGRVYTFDKWIVPLNILGGGTGLDEYAQVTKEFLMKTFKQLGGSTEYILSYSNLGVHMDVEGGGHYLLVRAAKKMRRNGKLYHFAHLYANELPLLLLVLF